MLDAPPGPDGKRKQTWSKGYATRKAAEVAVREELSRRDQGIVLSTEKLTVRQFMERWLDHMVVLGRDERTLERYRELIERGVWPLDLSLELAGLRTETVKPDDAFPLVMAARMGFEPMEALRLQRFSRWSTAIRRYLGWSGYIHSELAKCCSHGLVFRARPDPSGAGR